MTSFCLFVMCFWNYWICHCQIYLSLIVTIGLSATFLQTISFNIRKSRILRYNKAPLFKPHYLRVMRCSNDVPLKIDILDRIYVFAFSPSKTPSQYSKNTVQNFTLVTAVGRCYADRSTAVVELHITFSFACDLVKNFESSLPCFSAK